MNIFSFLVFSVFMPCVLSIIYSKDPDKYQLKYNVTKSCWYLIYAILMCIDYLIYSEQRGVVEFAITLAIMEGLPLILIPAFKLFTKNKDK